LAKDYKIPQIIKHWKDQVIWRYKSR